MYFYYHYHEQITPNFSFEAPQFFKMIVRVMGAGDPQVNGIYGRSGRVTNFNLIFYNQFPI